jgi:hypothetical protein
MKGGRCATQVIKRLLSQWAAAAPATAQHPLSDHTHAHWSEKGQCRTAGMSHSFACPHAAPPTARSASLCRATVLSLGSSTRKLVSLSLLAAVCSSLLLGERHRSYRPVVASNSRRHASQASSLPGERHDVSCGSPSCQSTLCRNSGGENIGCSALRLQVPGCEASLATERAYYQR